MVWRILKVRQGKKSPKGKCWRQNTTECLLWAKDFKHYLIPQLYRIGVLLLCPFYRFGNWGMHRLRTNLASSTQINDSWSSNPRSLHIWALSSSGQYECCLLLVLVCTAAPLCQCGTHFHWGLCGDCALCLCLPMAFSLKAFLTLFISDIRQRVGFCTCLSELWLQPCCAFICEMIDLDSDLHGLF